MPEARVSTQEVLVYLVFKTNPKKWLTAHDVALRVGEAVKPRTVRFHIKRLTDMGVLDHVALFPAPRYRFSPAGHKDHAEYCDALVQAAGVLALHCRGMDVE